MRVVAPLEEFVLVVVPEWDWETKVSFPWNEIPQDIRPLIIKDFRFFSMVNTNAATAADLKFKGCEPCAVRPEVPPA